MARFEQVEQLLEGFAERTGLMGSSAPQRYLWTDAFAVCTYLSLHRARADEKFLGRARALVDQVHDVLGAYADNDPRSGRIGARSEQEHAASPTGAGLRIGKQQPERKPGEAFDERREWDRDGQYFHYLTRWMHALERVAETTGERHYHRWAVDLALAAFAAFVHQPPGGASPRMVWKMSVDLDRPLVPSMGHHDPLDGWVVTQMLLASDHGDEDERSALRRCASVYREIFAPRDLATGDPLGIGGLLVDAWQLFRIGPDADPTVAARIPELIEAAAPGLEPLVGQRQLDAAPRYRLGFRELGLATGLHAVQQLNECRDCTDSADPARLGAALTRIAGRLSLAEEIERTWLDPANRALRSWTDHRDINDVMLAACLAPAGYLGPAPGRPSQQETSS
ncbi:MAG: hypothetical protein ACOCVP_00460 [Wenzhouxiangella sp.]